MEKSSKNIPAAQKVQKAAVQLLNQYNLNDKLQLEKTEGLFLSCADAFIDEWNGKKKSYNATLVEWTVYLYLCTYCIKPTTCKNIEYEDEKQDDQDVEIFTGDEVVSMLDPIELARIQHPARCIFCTHNTSFDAVTFFKFQVTSMVWNCPICSVRIRGIQVRLGSIKTMAANY